MLYFINLHWNSHRIKVNQIFEEIDVVIRGVEKKNDRSSTCFVLLFFLNNFSIWKIYAIAPEKQLIKIIGRSNKFSNGDKLSCETLHFVGAQFGLRSVMVFRWTIHDTNNNELMVEFPSFAIWNMNCDITLLLRDPFGQSLTVWHFQSNICAFNGAYRQLSVPIEVCNLIMEKEP